MATDQLTDNPADYQRLTDVDQYVVNRHSRRVHRRFRVGSELADFARCNLDDIADRRDVEAREEIVDALDGRKPVACLRCFPAPTPEARALAAAPVGDDVPAFYDPELEGIRTYE